MKLACYIARDRAGGLVGFYRGKPTEVTCKDSKPDEHMKYFRGPEGALIHTMTYESYLALYASPIGLGECYEAQMELLLKA